jgi:hypothetical protein
LLWPDSEPDTARNSPRQRLFQLRKQLGVTLVSGSTTLALSVGLVRAVQRRGVRWGCAHNGSSVNFAPLLVP